MENSKIKNKILEVKKITGRVELQNRNDKKLVNFKLQLINRNKT